MDLPLSAYLSKSMKRTSNLQIIPPCSCAEGLARRPEAKSIPLSRYSSGDPQPGTGTKSSQNLYYCIPFVSFLKRAPLGFAAYSSLRVLRKVSFSQFIHNTSKLTAYVIICSILNHILDFSYSGERIYFGFIEERYEISITLQIN